MSGSGRTRFDWFKAVYAEPEFTEGDKAVLGYIVIIYIRRSPTFCIRQSVIAQRCGVSEKTVRRAIQKARRLGYFVLTRERKRGPGQDRGNELKLMFPPGYVPKRQDNLSGHSENEGTNCPERGDKFDPNEGTNRPERGDRANSLTSQNRGARGDNYRGDNYRGDSRGAQSASLAMRDDDEEIFEAELDKQGESEALDELRRGRYT